MGHEFILLTYKVVQVAFISVDTMLTENSVVIDLERFHYNKSPFFNKNFAVFSRIQPLCLVQTALTNEILSTDEKRALTWLTRNLHGID